MDLRWLEDVLVLLEEDNLSRAARRRAVTQPAFSRRIRAFEHWLGQDILDRDSNRVHVRDSLRENEAEIRALFQRLGELQQRVREGDGAGRTMSITMPHALAMSLMSDFLELFRQTFGAIRFRLRTADRSECISTFVRGDADLLICYMATGDPSLKFDASFPRVIMGKDYLLPVIAPALEGVPQVDDLPQIAYPEQSYLGQVLAHAQQAGRLHLVRARPICDTEFSMAAREMAIHGQGLAWLPASLIREDIAAKRLIDLNQVLGAAELEIALFARSEAALDAAKLEALATAIRELPRFSAA